MMEKIEGNNKDRVIHLITEQWESDFTKPESARTISVEAVHEDTPLTLLEQM